MSTINAIIAYLVQLPEWAQLEHYEYGECCSP